MATAQNDPSTGMHSIAYEVSGDQTAFLESVLSQIDLNDAVSRVRIEIESTKPVLKDAPTSSASEEPEQPDEAEDNTPTTATTDAPETTLKKHVTDSLTGDGDFQKRKSQLAEKIDTGDAAIRYSVEADDIGSRSDPQIPSYFDTWIDCPRIKPDTQRWYLMGVLYRCQGYLTPSQIERLVDDTPWEMPYNSLSAQLSKLKHDGLTMKHHDHDGYQLTQLGRDYMDALVVHSKGYHLKPADHIREEAAPEEKTAPEQLKA